MFRSATFKLTLYYLLIITAISIAFSGVVYAVGMNDLSFGLQRQTERITQNFPVFYNSPYLHTDREYNEGREHLIRQLVLLNVVVIGLAGIASYGLARRTLRPIEAAHERQKQFTADVSHELRTPLTALKMESEVALMDKAANAKALRAVIKSTVEESEKLTLLISNLLRLSQLDAAEHIQLTPLPLTPIVAAAVQQVQAIADQRSIVINDDWQAATALVKADEGLLQQLIIILLDNAIKYSRDGSTVAVAINSHEQHATVTIVDQGRGIARQDLDHVFERFYRADTARSEEAGFGIGLSIAKLIADHHKASIHLTSQKGHGTTAQLRLPLAAQPAKRQN